MSQRTVQLTIGRLVTDGEFRFAFLLDPRGFLTALREEGVDLSLVEIDALVRTDRRVWDATASRIDADLQKTSFRG